MIADSQLALLPDSQTKLNLANTPAPALRLLACSGTKLDHPARAIDLYQGVMYQSYRAHVFSDTVPQVLILSSKHGFLEPETEIAPYDERMTPQCAEQMLADLATYVRKVAWPSRIGKVMLAGGQQYRRVMRAALARRYGQVPPLLHETTGGIGMQRSQLGAFLDGLPSPYSEPFGQHPNGTPLFRRHGWLEAGSIVRVVYGAAPGIPARMARVLSLFEGPNGPTADVEVEESFRGHTRICPRWVRVQDLQPSAV